MRTAPVIATVISSVALKKMLTPVVVGHRGASGYRPEHTLAAYELAARQGADLIELDLVSTRDGVLVARHENEISGTTDVAEHPEFADRRTTKVIDGAWLTGWFTEDFTLTELKTLRATERIPQVRQQNTMYDGMFEVPTFEEVLELRERLSKELRRPIGVSPETKHPTYFDSIGLSLEEPLLESVRAHGLDEENAPIYIQSFEHANLRDLRHELGAKAPLVFLSSVRGGPVDDSRSYADYRTVEGLELLAQTVHGIGPTKDEVIARAADGTLGQSTGLVDRAHAAGLKVMPYTFRAENTFLPTDYRVGSDPADLGRALEEQKAFMREGVDGLFCDHPEVCVEARKQHWTEQD
ncbi:glycerophosphodiester phosphodiesterase [Janibacter endophyticus]|uniref:glycerophosphodiester phosphodiesterase n=1 Tax=Janibacter endophyticus TaxID=2806261 RepID=UPI0027DB0CE4|nr:glycerophosphodiester phosphodiesterase [Janibacter endophyticus]